MMARRNDDEFQTFEVVEAGMREPESPDTESTRRAKATLENMSGTGEVGEGYIAVSKIERGNEERCEKIPADKYTYDDLLDYVKGEYGPGDYRLRLYVRGDKNRYQLAENRLETLRGSVKQAAPVPVTSGIDPTLVALLERQQVQIEAITKRMESHGQFDASKMINTVAGFVTAVAPVLPLFIGQRKSGMSDLKELLAITQGVKDLQGPPTIEAASGTSTLDLINTGMQAFAALLSQRQANPVSLMTPAPVAALPTPAALPPAPAQVATDDPDVSLFAMQADLLLQACKADPTAEGATAAAMMAAAQIPDAIKPAVMATLEHPFFMRALMREAPQLLDIIDWLGYMREELFDILDAGNAPTGENHVTGDTGRDAGDSGHPETNAGDNPPLHN